MTYKESDPDDIVRVDRQSSLEGYEAPALCSDDGPWDSIVVEAYDFDHPTDLPTLSFSNVAVSTLRRGLAHLWTEGRHKMRPMTPGQTFICPTDVPIGGGNSEPSAWITTYLRPSLLESVAAGLSGPAGIEIVPSIVSGDRQIESLSHALESEVKSNYCSGRLFGDFIAIALAVHLLARYAADPLKIRDYRGGMPRYLLRRSIEYMQSNLATNLHLSELAENVGMTPWHFCRAFKQSTGLSPHQYVMQQRIAAARKRLTGPHPNIGVIAREVGFTNPSHFASVFKRITGYAPRDYVLRL